MDAEHARPALRPEQAQATRDGPSGTEPVDELTLERAARAQAEESARRAKFVSAASATLVASLNAEDVLERLAQLAIAHFADFAAVWLAAPTGLPAQPLRVAHANPRKRRAVQELLRRYPLDPFSPVGVETVAKERVPVFIERFDDALIDKLARDPEHRELIAALDVRSVLMVPLISRDRVVGVLALATAESGRRFDAIDRELVSSLTWRAALAIDNAQLYRAARDAMAARDELLAFVSHDLRHPLQVILSAVGRLGAADLDETTRADHVALVRRTMRRMQTLTSDLLTVCGPASVEALAIEPLDLQAIAAQVTAEFEARCAEAGVALTADVEDELPQVPGDAMAISRVLTNLIDNAVKATPRGGSVQLAAWSEASAVAIGIRDDGPGLDAERVAQLIADAPPRSRSGLGLTIVRRLVDAHGGGFDVRPIPDGGSEVIVRLPL